MNIEDQADLHQYLLAEGWVENQTNYRTQMLSGGVSNRTVLFESDNRSWVIKQALEKLRVTGDWRSGKDRIYYEAAALRWMHNQIPDHSPELIFEDKSHYILAMKAIRPPFSNFKDILLQQNPRDDYLRSAGKLLAQIHTAGIDQKELPQLFYDRQFFKSLRLEPYYLETCKRLPFTTVFIEALIAETEKDPYTLVHGDFSPKNLLIKNDNLVLLDYEVMHVGDGTFDLGFFITHLLAKSIHQPSKSSPFLKGALAFYEDYRHLSKIDTRRELRAVKHTIACLLARVVGLSPLEYLDSKQKELQKATALKLIESPPSSIIELINKFQLLTHAEN